MTDPSSMGAYLRAARRARRVSIERAAEETRIRPDFLMRMESDEFDFLAPTYVRGFLRSYARYLRADPEPLMKEFDARYGSARVETAQIAALERHGKQQLNVPRPLVNGWKGAALIAGAFLVILAGIGILNGPEPETPSRVASATESPSPETSASPSASVEESPSPSVSPSEDGTIAFDDGIKLVILASKGDCWIQVEEDGVEATGAGILVPQGERATFKADEELSMRLGYPRGVELIVNGQNVGSPGGEDPVDLVLPDDIDAFL